MLDVMTMMERGPIAYAVRIGNEVRLCATMSDAEALSPPGAAPIETVYPYNLDLKVSIQLRDDLSGDPDKERQTIAQAVVQQLAQICMQIKDHEQTNAPKVIRATECLPPKLGKNPNGLRIVRR